jgi:hypothetical protein
MAGDTELGRPLSKGNRGHERFPQIIVMAGLVPAIHVFLALEH